MKIIKKTNTYIFLFLVLSGAITSISLGNSNKNQIENKSGQDYPVEYYSNNKDTQYVIPHTVSKSPDYILHHRSVIPLENNINIMSMPHVQNIHMGSLHPMPMPVNCACAAQVRCKPCAVLAQRVEPDVYPFMSPMDCPCAPKLNCPICPPLSLLHEIASKKVFKFYNKDHLGFTRSTNGLQS
jgi:hypothetical protein